MITLRTLDERHGSWPSVVTVGKFDGLHLGHAELLSRVRTYSEEHPGTERIFLSFDMGKEQLLTKEERAARLEDEGMDVCVDLPFTESVRNLDPASFAERILKGALRAEAVAVGADFRFGRDRAGGTDTLRQLGKTYGFSVIVVPDVMYGGEPVSSTRIREAISCGKMEEAEAMLGEPYSISGVVTRGREIGRTMGFPTANIIPPEGKILPPFGVYAVRAAIGRDVYEGVANIGVKPTVGSDRPVLETHLFSFGGGELYGFRETVRFCRFIRPERRFGDLARLRDQIDRDRAEAYAYFH